MLAEADGLLTGALADEQDNKARTRRIKSADPLDGLLTTAAAPQTQPDQLIQLDLGRHQLLCGDATDPEQVARLMDGVQAQLAAADPPCGMAKERDRAANDNLRGEALGAFSTSWCFSTPRCSSS